MCANRTEPQRGYISAVTCVDAAAYQGTHVHPGFVHVSRGEPVLPLLSGMEGRGEAPAAGGNSCWVRDPGSRRDANPTSQWKNARGPDVCNA